MIDVEKLLRIEYHGERVLTTKQLAAAYGCSVQLIRQNFAAAKEQFEESVHYFQLKGAELRIFKEYLGTLKASNRANIACAAPDIRLASSIYLWTHSGCVRHCKMVGTDKAWEVFNMLEQAYFASLEQSALLKAAIEEHNAATLDLLIQIIHRDGIENFERVLDKWIKLTR